MRTTSLALAPLLALGACAHDPDPDPFVAAAGYTFAEPRQYHYDSPADDQPEYSTDFSISFCPDGSVPHYFPGGDIAYQGYYRIADGVVRIKGSNFSALDLLLSEDGQVLLSGEHVLERVDIAADDCPEG